MITKRTVKGGLREDRLERIVREAAEQSGRGRVPIITPILDFKEAITRALTVGEDNYFFHTDATERPLFAGASGKIGLFVGPEGGWTETEIEEAREAGVHFVTLGPRILRGETAAIVASFLATS
jgi:16S rRNA (uracil1498-N3)-methyltransferase